MQASLAFKDKSLTLIPASVLSKESTNVCNKPSKVCLIYDYIAGYLLSINVSRLYIRSRTVSLAC